ncbi:cytochrome P450 [Parachaetomium inaequale]|uniref:Cytochrome P450 n=1 Tax=Parachaetomium inaequale TaxID=2588326 RepID=A0AAN6SQJ8_9PEZI|nr:cytochrome P450 [Parachaetomium inaequale]
MLLDTALQHLPSVLWTLLYAIPVLRYGPVVRLGPNHLSYTDVGAWKDIFGHRAGEHIKLQENPKSRMFYRDQIIDRSKTDATNIIDADREEHSRLRRAVAGGFSEKAMREQEPVIAGYVDMLVDGIRRRSEKGEEVDIVKWYNWATFDVVGDLVFAESFGCLEGERGHPFVNLVTGLAAQAAEFTAMKYAGLQKVPGFKWGLNKVVKFVAKDLFSEMQRVMGAKLQHRLEVKEERTDLFEGLMSKREEWNLDMNRLQANAAILAAAGSETTASLLTGVSFLLLQNPDAMEKLKHEVRSSFNGVADITITSVGRLPYLLACLNEGLRRYPPAVSNLPREVHEGGEMICGEFVPEETIVEVQHYAMNHSSQHWHDPFAFKPERWLNKVDSELGEAKERGEKDADGDRLEAMQTFSVGPRNCVGRNLAYAEMRLIMARIIFEFDMELADQCRDWLKNARVYTIWEKEPLYVRFTPVKRG